MEEQQEKKEDTYGWLSIAVSIFFVVRGIMKISGDSPGIGYLFLAVGIGGLCWKGYEMIKARA
jgi:hypothetical protein